MNNESSEAGPRPGRNEFMQQTNFDEVLEQVLQKDARYHRDAYYFLREGLDYTQKKISKTNKSEVRHITGQELLHGLREFALSQFGPMTMTVLNEWGVRGCEDFGEVVFNMVDFGLLSKTETDSREDFKGVFTFEEAFRKPFLPAVKPSSSPLAEPNQPKA